MGMRYSLFKYFYLALSNLVLLLDGNRQIGDKFIEQSG